MAVDKPRRSFKAGRQRGLIQWLASHGQKGTIGDLCQAFGVSALTIRRDLAELQDQGLVRVARGGVFLSDELAGFEVAFGVKAGEELEDKERIAQKAASLVRPGETILLDGGTTVGAMAKYLIAENVTVVTNALNIMETLSASPSVRLIGIGGEFRQTSHAFLGPTANRMLEELHVDQAFMGTESFAARRGLEVPDWDDAEFKRCAVNSAAEVWVLATPSKYNRSRLHRFATWESVKGLITATGLPDDDIASLTAASVEVVVV